MSRNDTRFEDTCVAKTQNGSAGDLARQEAFRSAGVVLD